MTASSEQRALRASLLYAGIEIARDMQTEGGSPGEALAYIRQGDAQRNSFDYDGAFDVAEDYGWEVFSADSDTGVAFRLTLTNLLEHTRPVWVRVLPAGRRRVVSSLDDDALQCLEIADLLGYEYEAVAWWDRLAALGRLWDEEARVAIGRDAEKRAMARERLLLAGTGKDPRWVAIEDNGAGYDIQTWRPRAGAGGDGSLSEHHVEVKGSSLTGIVHLSRGEWEFAIANADHWEMQVWLSGTDEPGVLGVDDLRSHIPDNRGEGRWAEVEISTDRLVPMALFEVDTPLPQPILASEDLPLLPGVE